MTLFRIPTRLSAAVDRPALYGNQTICSTRPSCWIQISSVDVINVAADHQIFMTLTGELSWHRLRRLTFTQKNQKSLFLPPFKALRGNVRTLSIAPLKARGRLNLYSSLLNFFAISYGWDVMSGNQTKSAFLDGGGSLWAQISEGTGHRPPTIVGVKKLELLPFRVL